MEKAENPKEYANFNFYKMKFLNYFFSLLFILTINICNGQIIEDFSGSPVFFSDFVQSTNPYIGEYGILNTTANISTTSGTITHTWNTITGNGQFMVVDGFTGHIPKTVWEMPGSFTASTSSHQFGFDFITRQHSQGTMSVNFVIELINPTTSAVLSSTPLNLGQTNTWTFQSVSLNTNPGTSYRIRIVQINSGSGYNDYALDNLTQCSGAMITMPSFTINGVSSPITVCDINDIKLNINWDPAAMDYYVEIRNISTGDLHTRNLSLSEINAANLSNFDLSIFANTPGTNGLNGSISNSISLNVNDCYEVTVATRNECNTNWFSSSETFCVEEGCSVESRIEFENWDNPIRFNASGNSGTSYFWDFGDGTSSTHKNPIHLYAQPGVYNVTLLTYESTPCGTCCDVMTLEIEVFEGHFDGTSRTWTEGGERSSNEATGTNQEMENEDSEFEVYPNPANNNAQLQFEVKNTEVYTIQLFDATGNLVQTLLDEKPVTSGTHQINVNTTGLSSGMYHIVAKSQSTTRNISLVISK